MEEEQESVSSNREVRNSLHTRMFRLLEAQDLISAVVFRSRQWCVGSREVVAPAVGRYFEVQGF